MQTAQITSMEKELKKDKPLEYFTTDKICCPILNLTEEGFELAFDTFITSGHIASSEHWYATGAKMYCSPRNGGQMAEFARALYTIFLTYH